MKSLKSLAYPRETSTFVFDSTPLSKPDNTGRYGLFLENLVIFFYHFLLDVAFSDVKITLSGNTAEIQGDKLIKLTKEVCNKITVFFSSIKCFLDFFIYFF